MRRVRDTAQGYHPHAFSLSFIVEIEERFILLNGAAQRASKLIVMELSLGRGRRVEVISRIQGTVPEIFDGRAVQCIGSGFAHNVDSSSRVTPVFRHEVRNNLQLLYCVDRQHGGGCAKDSGFVDRGVVAIAVIHVGTVKQVIIGSSARAIHGKDSV